MPRREKSAKMRMQPGMQSMATAPAGQVVNFSTDLVPVRDRLPYLREAYGHWIARLDLEQYAKLPLR